ncbi:MAG: amidohydrolase family protein [Aeromicrobium sp.]
MTGHVSAHGLLLRDVEVDDCLVDVRVRGDRVVEVGTHLRAERELRIDGRGGALLPGLHDHHLHLHAMAAAETSVDVGPSAVASLDELAAALRSARPTGGWIRAVGYHESVAGDIDRSTLDAALPGMPVRVQHRGGALWILSSAALDLVAPLLEQDLPGIERDAAGRPTGRLWRLDHELQPWLPDRTTQQRDALAGVARHLLSLGITGVTDATPAIDHDGLGLLHATNPLRLHLLGAPDDAVLPAGWSRGPRKLLLHDHDLPTFDDLLTMIDPQSDGSHRRPVAVHCVTRESLILTLAALDTVGSCPGDRIEHGAVIPPDLDDALLAHRLVVVTQPDFLRSRGDDYLRDVDAHDRDHLYRWATLGRSGVPVVPSSDAPFGETDPWQVIRSARDRRTSAGATVGPDDRVDASTALAGYLTTPGDPGGRSRRIQPGATADLCLLGRPRADVLADPSASHVETVIVGGTVAWTR